MEDITIVPPSQPFRWKGRDYTIQEVGVKDDQAYASVEPHNPQLKSELEKRIKKDSGLIIFFCHGYVCFVEDYRKKQTKALR